jgi:hypothetical protein
MPGTSRRVLITAASKGTGQTLRIDGGGSIGAFVEPHVQTEIRATLSTTPLI